MCGKTEIYEVKAKRLNYDWLDGSGKTKKNATTGTRKSTKEFCDSGL